MQGKLALLDAWLKESPKAEFHLYSAGSHGFGMGIKGTTSDLWIEQFYAWMKARGYLMRSAPAEKAGR